MPDTVDLLPDATRRLIRTADGLEDADYAAPSGLPGWSRGHVLAHLALNAEGLAGALTGVVEGRSVPMYRSQESRNSDIEELAAHGPAEIRTRLLGGATDLAEALIAVPDDLAGTVIERTPGSDRTFLVSEVAWMRLREVEVHHADLACGYDRSRWPAAFAGLLVDSLVPHCAATASFRAHATDLDRTVTVGDGGPTVSGTAADLGWWMTGRGTGDGLTSDDGELPRIGAW